MSKLDRTKPPPFNPFEDFHLTEAVTIPLGKKGKLHYINAGDQEVLHVEVIFNAGSWFESVRGQAYFMGLMLKEGTDKLTSQQISTLFDQHGAYIEVKPGLDRLSVGCYFLSKHIQILLPVLKAVIFDSTFPEQELVLKKQLQLDELKIQNEKIGILASKNFRATLFGEKHPYGAKLEEKDIQNIERKHLVKYHSQFIDDNFEIILSGKVDNEILRIIKQTFCGTNSRSTKTTIGFPPLSFDPQNILSEKEESIQSAIRMGKPMPSKNDPDFHKLLVINEILGGYFGSRLMKNIREDKGFTYGIHSAIVNFKHAGYFIIGTEVKKSFTKQTLKEIQYEIKKLQTEIISDEELVTVKNYMIGTFRSSITSPFSLADKFKGVHFHGLSYEYYQQYVDILKAIDGKEIRNLAKKYFPLEDMTTIVVGGY